MVRHWWFWPFSQFRTVDSAIAPPYATAEKTVLGGLDIENAVVLWPHVYVAELSGIYCQNSDMSASRISSRCEWPSMVGQTKALVLHAAFENDEMCPSAYRTIAVLLVLMQSPHSQRLRSADAHHLVRGFSVCFFFISAVLLILWNGRREVIIKWFAVNSLSYIHSAALFKY